MFNNSVSYIRDRAFTYINSIDLFYLGRDICSGHPPAVHANDGLFQLIAHPLTLGNELGRILTVAVPGDIEDHISKRLGLYCFPAVPLIAQMFFEFCLEHFLNTLLEKIIEE